MKPVSKSIIWKNLIIVVEPRRLSVEGIYYLHIKTRVFSPHAKKKGREKRWKNRDRKKLKERNKGQINKQEQDRNKNNKITKKEKRTLEQKNERTKE